MPLLKKKITSYYCDFNIIVELGVGNRNYICFEIFKILGVGVSNAVNQGTTALQHVCSTMSR